MLTKSDFTRFLQCPKYLWLNKHRDDLLPKVLDAMTEKIFREAAEVEGVAYRLFPEGVSAYEEDFKGAVEKTERLIAKGAKALFQPTFSVGLLSGRCLFI